MRLRVTIRRHSLPDTNIIWVIDTTSTPSPTIFHLLEQINDIVPIESDGQWGLEDYAVELMNANGPNYECLHFQPVASVLKEEDEVVIRPLLTQDLKIRRISGRHQISADGKRLIDGLALGRPLLRRGADRPPINIPPRKRRRITHNDDEDEDDDEGFHALKELEAHDTEENQERQLVLHADFDEDSEDDEDFLPGDDNDNDEFGEDSGQDSNDDAHPDLQSSHSESESESDKSNESSNSDSDSDSDDSEQGENEIDGPVTDSQDVSPPNEATGDGDDDNELTLTGVRDPAIRARIRTLHSIFPKSTLAVCKHVLNGTVPKGDLFAAYDAMVLGFTPTKPKSAITEISQDHDNLSIPKIRQKSRALPVKEPEEKVDNAEDLGESDGMEVDEETSKVLAYYDQNGLPPGSILAGRALKFMAEAIQTSPKRSQNRKSSSVSSGESSHIAENEGLNDGLKSTPFIDKKSQEANSSDEDSSDDDSSDSSSDDSSSDGSSDSDSSDAAEEGSANPQASSSSGSDSDSDDSSDSSSDDEGPEEKTSDTRSFVPPGEGLKKTYTRNQRRQHVNVVARWKAKGILPAGTTTAEFLQMFIDDDTTPEDAQAALDEIRKAKVAQKKSEVEGPAGKGNSKKDDFELRKAKLLADLASGGVDVGEDLLSKPSASMPVQENQATAEELIPDVSMDEAPGIQSASHSTPAIDIPQSNPVQLQPFEKGTRRTSEPSSTNIDTPIASPKLQPASTEPSQTRRSKLDLGAGKRLLFGALGIRTPKTKKDEEKIRNDLMKNIRPLVNQNLVAETETNDQEPENEDMNAWRSKIIYRAVECVQDGVQPSEPPFPFVQRWDPQQQTSWPQKGGRGGKRKKNQRDQEQYYDENGRASKKQKRKGRQSYSEEQQYLDESYQPTYQGSAELDYDDSTQMTEKQEDDVDTEINQQLMSEVQTPAANSQVPEDLAPLPDDPNTLPALQDGKARVGMTIAFKKLEMSAKTKWQPQISAFRTAIVIALPESGVLQLSLAIRDRETKSYDDETGERIYERFEMPDDDMEEEDDGILDIAFNDLIDSKIVQEPPENLENDALLDAGTENKQAVNSDLVTRDQGNAADSQVINAVSDVPMADSPEDVDGPSANGSKTISHEEEPAELQFSHVTETPLNSDAPESYQDRQVVEEPLMDETLQVLPVLDKARVAEVIAPNLAMPALPETPSAKGNIENEQVSDEARERISDMMKDAGFRSSIPSSVTRAIRPEGFPSPGEEELFAKLLNELTDADGTKAYSPKFNGLGSSPSRKQKEPSPALLNRIDSLSSHNHMSASWEPFVPPAKPRSSWETIEQNYQGSSPPPSAQEQHAQVYGSAMDTQESAWATDNQPSSTPAQDNEIPSTPRPDDPAEILSLPVRKPSTSLPDSSQRSVENKKSVKRVPIPSKAQALWEALQPKSRGESEDSSSDSEFEPSLGLDGSEEKEAANVVQYPKLSVGSSFTSQITDHGRQPDFNFDDTVAANVDTPDDPDFNLNNSEPEARGTPKNKKKTVLASNTEPELPTRKSTFKASVAEDDPSSDEFPTLEALSQQTTTIKRETPKPAPSNAASKKAAKNSRSKKMTPIQDAETSEDSDQSTPKASQRNRAVSNTRSLKSSSAKSASQPKYSVPRASPPTASQSRNRIIIAPDGSQIHDLTFSSDAEPDKEPEKDAAESSDDIRPRKFKKYDLASDDDEEYEDASGWVPKKNVDRARRATGTGLRNSSQASPSTRSRRRTSTR